MPRLSRLIVVIAVVIAVFGSLAVGFGTDLLQTGDETAHLDYAVELWRGHLPVFERGLEIHPAFGVVPPVQWVSQHPPFFYALLAPVVGPLVDGGHVVAAVLAGRIETALLAGVTVLATVWSTRRVLPSRPGIAALAAVLTALSGMLLQVGGAIYNDLLTVTFSALALGVAAAVIRRGATTRLIVLAAVVTAGGMFARLSFAVMLVAVVGSFVVAARLPGPLRSDVLRRGVGIVAAVLAPVLVSGWFYVRNRMLTGTITGGHPEWSQANLHRVTRSSAEVATDPVFWRTLFGVYRFDLAPTNVVPWILLLVPLALAGVWALAAVPSWRSRATMPGVWITVMGVLVVLVTIVVEIRYVAGGGAPNARYALPLLPVLVVPMAMGLVGPRGLLRRIGLVVLAPLWTLVAGAVFVAAIDLGTAHGPAVDLLVTRIAFVVTVLAVLASAAATVVSARLTGCRSAN